MAKKNENTSVVTEELATVAPVGALVVDEENDFSAFAGHETKITADELVTERVRIVQALTKGKRDATPPLTDGQLYGNISRKGMDSAVICPMVETRTVIERTGDGKGTFVKEYTETRFGSNDFQDATINALVRKFTFKDLFKAETGNGNKLSPTYNCYCAFLDDTGTEVRSFGVLQADKTNNRPFTKWMEERAEMKGANAIPSFAVRSRVDGKGEYTNSEGQLTQQYRFSPFKNNNWRDSLLSPKPEAQGGNLELLKKLEEHKKLVTSGAIKIADNNDEVVSEDAQEEAAF